MVEKVLKAAKKSLKKHESGSMKLKELVKLVSEKLQDDETITAKDIKKFIKNCQKFAIDGKSVSLKKSKKHSLDDAKNNTPSPPSNKRAKTEPSAAVVVEEESSSSSNDAAGWRTKNKIVLKHCTSDAAGAKISKAINADTALFPYTSFASKECSTSIAPALLRQCTEGNGFTHPSPIQAQAWPILLRKGSSSTPSKTGDIVGIAETGSGKTLAFGLPALSTMFEKYAKTRKSSYSPPRMLVLAPTRELAMQSDKVLQEFGAVVGLKSLTLYGGVPKYTQIAELKKGNVSCIVATPGRLKDLIMEGSCDLSQLDHLVLDEADRMLDMGFEEDVKYIISQCKSKTEGRQTAMFSATWPAAIQEIALEYMNEPTLVYVGFEAIVGSNGENAVDDSLSANKRVSQSVEVIEDRAREARLRQILQGHHSKPSQRKDRILIFALYKKEAERLEHSLKRSGFDVCSIHGNKHQAARTAALDDFKTGKCPLLVATDVAARGLDIPNVEMVINFTFPLTIEDYVHRIGRTGRAGKSGVSITFFQTGDKSHAGELQQVMKQANQPVPEDLMKFGSTIKKKEHKLYGNFGPTGGGPMKKATKITFDYSDEEN